MILKKLKIFVAGHNGLVGSAILRKLISKSYKNILKKTHEQLNLEDQKQTHSFFKKHRPDVVFIAAAKVGGIYANNLYPADFIMRNLQIQNNIFQSSYEFGVKKLFFLGSSCIYPKEINKSINEKDLLSGSLEITNQSYAIAKIAGVEVCRAFNKQHSTKWLAVMPANLYGPGDSYDLHNSHVMPALIKKIHAAKIAKKNKVIIWGSGKPMREFLYIDDLADALLFLLEMNDKKFNLLTNKSSNPLINIGTGEDISILDLAKKISEVVGFNGNFAFDKSKPDGTYRKVLNINKLKKLNWKYKIDLNTGLKLTYDNYKKLLNN